MGNSTYSSLVGAYVYYVHIFEEVGQTYVSNQETVIKYWQLTSYQESLTIKDRVTILQSLQMQISRIGYFFYSIRANLNTIFGEVQHRSFIHRGRLSFIYIYIYIISLFLLSPKAMKFHFIHHPSVSLSTDYLFSFLLLFIIYVWYY